jgi:hypothetical protein
VNNAILESKPSVFTPRKRAEKDNYGKENDPNESTMQTASDYFDRLLGGATWSDLLSLYQRRASTLGELSVELHIKIFEHLDAIDSVCLGLTNKRLYSIHRHLHGSVPLSTRRQGLNYAEKAWNASMISGHLFPILVGMVSLVMPVTLPMMIGGMAALSTLDPLRTCIESPCRLCGFSRCELHRHISDWAGKISSIAQ